MAVETKGRNVAAYAVVAGILSFGLYFAVREYTKSKRAEEIEKDIKDEVTAAKEYLDSITAGGRTPTQEELAVWYRMMEVIAAKEETLADLGRGFLDDLKDTLVSMAENWWSLGLLAGALIGTPIAGYMVIRMFNAGFRTCRIGPHRYKCGKCGYEATGEEDLAHHMTESHPSVTSAASKLIEAQGYFNALPAWVQVNIAADAGIYDRAYRRWDQLVPAEVWALAWGAAAAAAAGIGFAYLYDLIWMIPVLVLI